MRGGRLREVVAKGGSTVLQKYVYWGILFIKLAAIRNRILVNYFHYFSL